jgi:pilus assembly protein CpaF
VLTVRKFAGYTLAMDDLIRLGTVTQEATDFLATCVQGKLNILVAGGSGAGKTTLLNNLSTFIPEDERIITIEDAAEIRLHQQHVVRLEARPSNIEGQGEIRIRELVRNALRMRPDRIIVGEVRGAETLDMLQAMNTGHEGSLTTIHANSTRDALYRLETLILTAGIELPLRAIREQISSALDLVVHLTRLVDGSRRITHVTEIQHMEGEVITLQDIFVARAPDEEFAYSTRTHNLLEPLRSTGLKPQFLEKLAANGAVLPPSFFEGLEEAVAEPATGSSRRFTRL